MQMLEHAQREPTYCVLRHPCEERIAQLVER